MHLLCRTSCQKLRIFNYSEPLTLFFSYECCFFLKKKKNATGAVSDVGHFIVEKYPYSIPQCTGIGGGFQENIKCESKAYV